MIQTPTQLSSLKYQNLEGKYFKCFKRGRDKKVDTRNQKGSTKYIFYQIFSPSDTQEDSKFVFEKNSNPLR